jgi:hypothetical protein
MMKPSWVWKRRHVFTSMGSICYIVEGEEVEERRRLSNC